MKPISRTVAVLLITVLLFSLISAMPKKMNTPSANTPIYNFNRSDSVRIDIRNDSAFIDYGWSGSGTEFDPFVLQNQALGMFGDYGYITIGNTDSHFVIRHCQLRQMDIVFWNVSNGRFEDCTFINSSIILGNCLDCELFDNEFSNTLYGEETVWLLQSSGCKIIQNSFSNGFVGLLLHESNDTTISDNTFTDFIHGGVSGELANTTLINNVFSRTGVRMEFWDSRIPVSPPTIENNVVNGKELGIFFSLVGAQVEAEQYGQVILVNCNDTTIIGGTFIDCSTGVQIVSCNNCTVESTSISDCSWQGITAERSAQTRIIDSQIRNCSEEGVFLSVCPFYIIENCTIEDNLGGVYPHIYSNNGTVANCTIRRNKSNYPYYGGVAGISLSNNSTVIGNIITENGIGIFIYGAHCLVIYNVITYNEYGIYIGENLAGYGESPNSNRIYGNEIGWNHLANAHDGAWSYNEWDDGVSLGNCWSDYYGIGNYEISRHNIDHFPKLLPEGGIPLFFVHVGVGISSSIIIVVLIVVILKRRVKSIE